MAYLYLRNDGTPWFRHSFSAGQDFDGCPYRYYLRRVLGWKRRENKAALLFGQAIEKAVQYYHEHEAQGGVEHFQQLWSVHEKDQTIQYTKVERDWPSTMRMGTELLQLYGLRQSSLPIPLHTKFQREYSKEVFPGDPNYGGIEHFAKLDIVAYVDPQHPMLPKIDWKPEYGPVRPLIVDMKATAKDFPEQPGMAAYHSQLRNYSWVTGVRDVAILTFKKTGHSLKKGSSVTLLKDVGPFKAGEEAVVAQPANKDLQTFLVRSDYFVELMDQAQGRREDGDLDTTKAAKERKLAWLHNNATPVADGMITRQRLQFNSGFVTPASANDAGVIVARQVREIVESWKTKQWPNTFGITFPHDDRNDPYFQAFVLNDQKFREANFEQAARDNFDDLDIDEEPEEPEEL